MISPLLQNCSKPARHLGCPSPISCKQMKMRCGRVQNRAGLDQIAAGDGRLHRARPHPTGILPGGLKVNRRAPDLWDELQASPQSNEREQLFDWLNCFAMAVNEENAAGGKVVTAPTNGAAGHLPGGDAILLQGCNKNATARESRRKFLLTRAQSGLSTSNARHLGRRNGFQGEVGVACSMAAGGLAAFWGGVAHQIASAAEIGMEHNLGLTCDPVGGLGR